MWRHEESRRLYTLLWLVLPVTLYVPAAQLSAIVGFYFLMKLFVVDAVFQRFPSLREKYDTSSLIWDTLPTDADLLNRTRDIKLQQVEWISFCFLFFFSFSSPCRVNSSVTPLHHTARVDIDCIHPGYSSTRAVPLTWNCINSLLCLLFVPIIISAAAGFDQQNLCRKRNVAFDDIRGIV